MTKFLKTNANAWSHSRNKVLLLKAYFSWLTEEKAWRFLLSDDIAQNTRNIIGFFLELDPSVLQRLPRSMVDQMVLPVSLTS